MINLKLARIKLGLNQSELAEKIDVQPILISRWETGRSKPDIITLGKLADVLQTTMDELMGR